MTRLYQNDKVCARHLFTFLDIYQNDKRQQHRVMSTIEETRRKNARQLATLAGSDAAFADKVGISASRVSQLIGKAPTKNIGHTTARRIEAAFGKATGWLDAPHNIAEQNEVVAADRSATGVTSRAASGEEIGEAMERFQRIASLYWQSTDGGQQTILRMAERAEKLPNRGASDGQQEGRGKRV